MKISREAYIPIIVFSLLVIFIIGHRVFFKDSESCVRFAEGKEKLSCTVKRCTEKFINAKNIKAEEIDIPNISTYPRDRMIMARIVMITNKKSYICKIDEYSITILPE